MRGPSGLLCVLLWRLAVASSGYWSLWPDGYARGGGLSNQLEQLLGRLQCAFRADAPMRTLVLPDFRADRASPPRRYPFGALFDVEALRGALDVATWREFLAQCGGVATVVEAAEAGAVPACAGVDAEARNALLKVHARGYEVPAALRHCTVRPPSTQAGAAGRREMRAFFDALPKCMIGLKLRELALLGPCTAEASPRRAFKSSRPCKGLEGRSLAPLSPCAAGLDWSGSLNASRHFRGLVSPQRADGHLGPCHKTALARLRADTARADLLLASLRPASDLIKAADAVQAMLAGGFDAVHVRLGDFDALCSGSGAVQRDRVHKFCPPSDAELALAATFLRPPANAQTLLVLSDDPVRAVRAIRAGDAARNVVSLPELLGNRTDLGEIDHSRLLILEMELATRAMGFVGVACSTVSQLIIKRREALRRPFYLWP
ncbi:hypothetical protein M885DRAFT_510686 [Pelagophyceae sp. CCMP2097]|nr:hypothetical protein M885DRAFT_510686 [Pelagophyceae sp. CCMP2097]